MRSYTDLSYFTEIEKKEHLAILNRTRRNRCYKNNKLKIIQDIEILMDLYDQTQFSQEDLELIEILECVLGV